MINIYELSYFVQFAIIFDSGIVMLWRVVALSVFTKYITNDCNIGQLLIM